MGWWRTFPALLLLIAVAGCNTVDEPAMQAAALQGPDAPAFPALSPTIQQPDTVKYYPSDEPLRLALEHFNRGEFGVAEKYFQDAVERAPKDVTAWVGLAACYDRLGRFDLADRAYKNAIRLTGETTEILNNEGYSYMLRGDLVRARQKLRLAQSREPDNPTIANNLRLLDSSYRFVRHPQFSEQ